jgi:aryl-alcohol dehydrogenase-like predicted oxidoreductase
MEHRKLGNTDMKVSVLGFGSSEIGYEGVAPATVKTLLTSALDAGLNVVDTAECYPNSEEMIGAAVAERRKEFYLFTKCGHPDGMASEDWRPESLLRSIQRSLKRLRTDHLDLIQLHSCSLAELRKGDVIGALETAREKGYSRYIGYSGDSDAAVYAVECRRFDTLQTSVSIADQESIERVIPRAKAANMGVIAKRPIANAAWRSGKKPANGYHHEYWERLRKLDYPFLKMNLEKAIAIALRFTLSVTGVHTAIVGTTKPGRWSENAELLKAGPLPNTEIEEVRKRWKQTAPKTWMGQT